MELSEPRYFFCMLMNLLTARPELDEFNPDSSIDLTLVQEVNIFISHVLNSVP